MSSPDFRSSDASQPLEQSPERTGLRVVMHGPEPGQIGALCRAVGLAPEALKRLRIGRLPLAGLAPGQWRCLRVHERF